MGNILKQSGVNEVGYTSLHATLKSLRAWNLRCIGHFLCFSACLFMRRFMRNVLFKNFAFLSLSVRHRFGNTSYALQHSGMSMGRNLSGFKCVWLTCTMCEQIKSPRELSSGWKQSFEYCGRIKPHRELVWLLSLWWLPGVRSCSSFYK